MKSAKPPTIRPGSRKVLSAKGLVQPGAWPCIHFLAALLTISALLYVWVHKHYPHKSIPDIERLIHLDAYGRATVVSAEDLNWYVGASKSVPLLTQMDERNKSISTRVGNLSQLAQDFIAQFPEAAPGLLAEDLDQGRVEAAAQKIVKVRFDLSPASLTDSEKVLGRFETTLRELAQLKFDQTNSVALLLPPAKFELFWTTPRGVLYEVVAWSIFGLLASLLYHSARYARKREFDKNEMFIAWSKLFYTPIIAVVLGLAIGQGLLHVGSVESRIWMIPMFGFLAGFNTRKAAKVVDALSKWALGGMADSLNGTGNKLEKGTKSITDAVTPPKTFDDIASQANAVLSDTLSERFSQLSKST